MFIGHGPRVFYVSSSIIGSDMSTAISRIYTSEGFAIAADGRKRRRDDGVIVTDQAQKIFKITGKDRVLACSFAGTVGFTPDDKPNEAAFDFVSETAKATRTADLSQARTLSEYAATVCAPVETALRSAKIENKFSAYPTDDPITEGSSIYVIARIFFDGYYHGIPSRAVATFTHENQVLRTTETPLAELASDLTLGYGSKVIADLLAGNSGGWIATYRIRPQRPSHVSLTEARAIVKAYVAACSDPRALDLDKERCSAIGGQCHAAIITKKKGFEWLSGYEPLSEVIFQEAKQEVPLVRRDR